MIKFEDYKFMSLGSNCADIWYLGQNRINGPVDNVVVKSFNCILSLMNKTFFNKIYEEPFKIEPKTWHDSDDLTKILDYKDFKLVHNNPNTDKFKTNLNIRLDNLINFISNMDAKQYLVFNFNSYFITEDHRPTTELLNLIDWLKAKKILHKVIFIQLFKYSPEIEDKWNAYLLPQEVMRLNLRTISIVDVTKSPSSYIQFKRQFMTAERNM